jgi:capsular polysaccharide transport system permease protein
MTLSEPVPAASDTADTHLEVLPPTQVRIPSWLRSGFLWMVLIPAFASAIYLFAIAAPQYRSEAQIMIRGIDAPPPSIGGFGQLLGAGGVLSNSQRETYSLIGYLQSSDALTALKKAGVNPAEIFRRPEADRLTRLWHANPQMEDLLEHYRDKVQINLDQDTGITQISVTTYRPADSKIMAQKILALGETRVNQLNARLISTTLNLAQSELSVAQGELADVQSALASFRNRSADIDPESSGSGGQKQVFAQQEELDRQRAILSDMRRYLSPSSPQIIAMQSKIAALQSGTSQTRGRLTGSPKSVAQKLGDYEELKLQQELAAKRYEVARIGFKDASERAEKERLFVVQIAQPSMPEKPVFPKPLRSLLTIFLGLLLAYALVRLVMAGIREHSA